MREVSNRLLKYIKKMSRISVFIIETGAVLSCLLILLSIVLFHTADYFSSPMRIFLLADEIYSAAATLMLVSPIVALILDIVIKYAKNEPDELD